MDECGFTQSTSDHFNRRRKSGQTKSSYTGPSVDHNPGLIRSIVLFLLFTLTQILNNMTKHSLIFHVLNFHGIY